MLDDRVIIDKTVTDQVSTWKSSRGLSDKVVADHACSGETCTYHRIGDVFVCEKTGNVHGKMVKLLKTSTCYMLLFDFELLELISSCQFLM